MKSSILISAIVAGALSAPIASAQDKHAHSKPAPGVDMSKDMDMSRMQENMKAMRAMAGPMMKGGGGHGGMMMGGARGGMKTGDMMKHHAMMEQRMDMMQMMMQHDQMTGSMPVR